MTYTVAMRPYSSTIEARVTVFAHLAPEPGFFLPAAVIPCGEYKPEDHDLDAMLAEHNGLVAHVEENDGTGWRKVSRYAPFEDEEEGTS